MAKPKRLFLIVIGVVGLAVAGLISQQRFEPLHHPTTVLQTDNPNIIARARVRLGTRFEETFTYADVEFVNRTNFHWKVKKVIYSCYGDTEKYYCWTPDVVPPGGTLRVHARLDLPGHSERVAEKSIHDTFWIEVETDGNPKYGLLVADIEGIQKNCLPDAPLYLDLQPSQEVLYRFHPHLNLRGIKVASTTPSLMASVDYSRKALRLKCIQSNNNYSGKVMVLNKDKVLRTIHVEVSSPDQLWFTPRFLGFGVLHQGMSTNKELKVIFNNPTKVGNEVQLLTSSVPAGEFRLVSAKQESTAVLLLLEFLPRKEGSYHGTLKLKVSDTILDIPWSCEIIAEE